MFKQDNDFIVNQYLKDHNFKVAEVIVYMLPDFIRGYLSFACKNAINSLNKKMLTHGM